MRKNLPFLVAVAALLAMIMIAGPWSAQARPPRSRMQVSPPPDAASSIEGTVKKVNPAKRTIEVSTGASGHWEKTLELTSGTKIRDEGRAATLDDIQEGVRVKASYETLLGKSFATRIDLMPTPPPKEFPQPTELPLLR
jgi:hypothetical protein